MMKNRAATILLHLAMTAMIVGLLTFSATTIHRTIYLEPGILTE